MKTILKFGSLFVIAIAMFLSSCAGSYYVSDQPVEPVYSRPVAPYADAVWIDGDWVWNGGVYVYRRGHWDHGRRGRRWARGSWQHTNRGYRWHRGHWQ